MPGVSGRSAVMVDLENVVRIDGAAAARFGSRLLPPRTRHAARGPGRLPLAVAPCAVLARYSGPLLRRFVSRVNRCPPDRTPQTWPCWPTPRTSARWVTAGSSSSVATTVQRDLPSPPDDGHRPPRPAGRACPAAFGRRRLALNKGSRWTRPRSPLPHLSASCANASSATRPHPVPVRGRVRELVRRHGQRAPEELVRVRHRGHERRPDRLGQRGGRQRDSQPRHHRDLRRRPVGRGCPRASAPPLQPPEGRATAGSTRSSTSTATRSSCSSTMTSTEREYRVQLLAPPVEQLDDAHRSTSTETDTSVLPEQRWWPAHARRRLRRERAVVHRDRRFGPETRLAVEE